MKRLLAAVAACAVAVAIANSAAMAASGVGVLFTDNVKWRTSAAAYSNGGIRDSLVFKADGSAAANRDTSAWIDVSDMVQGTQAATVSDSSLAVWLHINSLTTDPYSGSTFGIGSDSLYAYVEGTDNPANGPDIRLATNLTEILTLETNSNDAYLFKITWARWALQLAGIKWVRFIVRGDLNGCWEGQVGFVTNAANKTR